MSDPANSIGGASHGIYYLVDADGSCLAYDWEADEWFTRSFSEKPVAFRYSDNARSLIAILPTGPLTYLAVGGGSGDTDWSLAFGEEGDGKLRKTPCEVRAEIEGELTMSLLVDGVEASSFTLDESGRYPLPLKRGRHYQIKLSGTAAPGELEIREMEPRG